MQAAAAAAAARALRVNVTVAAASPQILPPPQISCDQEIVYFMENVFSMLILVGLVCLLNRGFEESYRLSFYISFLSARDRRKMQSMKNQADWLLHNIIPNHVTSKKTFTKALPQDYSENHRDIGVVFANLVNFNELGRMMEQNAAHHVNYFLPFVILLNAIIWLISLFSGCKTLRKASDVIERLPSYLQTLYELASISRTHLAVRRDLRGRPRVPARAQRADLRL